MTRFSTTAGLFYLKQTPHELSMEPAVTKVLLDQFHASVPIIIATNQEEDWHRSGSEKELCEVMNLAKKLWPIYATLGEYRLMVSSHSEEFKLLNRRGRLTIGLREFIKIGKAI